MATINANISALEKAIEKLATLKTECEAISVEANEKEGSGMSIEVIHAVDKEYASIKTTIILLLDNSIAFFNNVKTSLVNADDAAAKKMNGEAN